VSAAGRQFIQLGSEAELGTLLPLSAGVVAELPRTAAAPWHYYSVGAIRPDIAARLGWTQGNVWLRQPERDNILKTKAAAFANIDEAMRYVVTGPDSVHELGGLSNAFYFVVSGAALRSAGILTSRSTHLIDAIIERRAVRGGAYLRLFHFSPRDRNMGGRQVWP
jgi:hypothetical protein